MRITEKKENGCYVLKAGEEIYGEGNGIRLVQIVGQYEDIKEELGINLLTLFKALKEGIYTIHSKGKKRYPCLTYNNAVGYVFDFMFEQEGEYILSDYGATFSMTKKDVEMTQKAIEYVNSRFEQ